MNISKTGLVGTIPSSKSKLYNKRVKKAMTLDTETTIVYDKVAPYEVPNCIEYPKYNVIPDSIQEYENRNGDIRYSYMTDVKAKQIVFDIGYTISHRASGEILLSRRFLVEEVFLDMNLMKNAYYFEKYPQYIMELSRGEVQLCKWIDIIQTMEKDLIAFNIKDAYAFNMKFDKGAIARTHRHITNKTLYLWKANEVRLHCLWYISAQVIMAKRPFINIAIKEGWLTDAGNIKTNAEVCYKYLTQLYNFEEAHTALEDSIIETEILYRCYAKGEKFEDGLPNVQPWKIVKDKAEQLGILSVAKETAKENLEKENEEC